MAEKSQESSGCFNKIVLVLIIGAIFKQFGIGGDKEVKANNQSVLVDSLQIRELVKVQDSIADKLSGTYEGALYSNISIPAANVYPGYTNYTLEIYAVKVEGWSHQLQSGLVSDAAQAHFKTELRFTAVDNTGYSLQASGYAFYYPRENRICMYANSTGSVFGNDPCKFTLSGKNLVSDDGVLIKNKKK